MGQQAVSTNTELQDAFQVFNDMSQQLADSYRELENHVVHLNKELVTAQDDRLRELTEKERVADRLQSLLKALPAGVIVLDSDGVVIECNPAAVELLGEPLLDQNWIDVIQRAFDPRVDDGHDISLRDGRRVSLSTQSLTGEPGQILLLQDVTETRALQEGLNRHKRLSDMGEMAASLAHQIRTPLSAALLNISHLSNPKLDNARRVGFAIKTRASLQQLEAQVNDMLIFAKGGSVAGEAINVGKLLSDIRVSMEVQLQLHDARLTIKNSAGNCLIMGNREALRGAIQNLVNNALQACGQQAEIELVAQLKDQNNITVVVLTVTDNGPGIAEDVHEQLFEPFYTTRSRGNGLGLAVVRAVAHAHNGSVRVDSEEGRGASFSIIIPIDIQNPVLTSEQSLSGTVHSRIVSEVGL